MHSPRRVYVVPSFSTTEDGLPPLSSPGQRYGKVASHSYSPSWQQPIFMGIRSPPQAQQTPQSTERPPSGPLCWHAMSVRTLRFVNLKIIAFIGGTYFLSQQRPIFRWYPPLPLTDCPPPPRSDRSRVIRKELSMCICL